MTTQSRPQIFLDIFQQRVRQTGHSPAIRRRILNEWEPVSWREWWLDAERLATGFYELGMRPGDRILILSQTRYEWVVAEIATQMMGTPSVAVFPITTPANLEYIVKSSLPKFAIVEDPKQLKKFAEIFSSIETFVILEVEATLDEPDEQGHADIKLDEKLKQEISSQVLLYDEVVALGRRAIAENRNSIAEIRPKVHPEDCACIMYTSGTTGKKRGVMISHANIMAQLDALSQFDHFNVGDTQLLSLPLAHIFAKVLLWMGVKIGLQTAVGTGVRTLLPDALEVEPHLIALVPSIVESFESGIRADFKKFGSLRLKMLDMLWSGAFFDPVQNWRQGISSQIGRTSIQRLFGDRISCFITGGAALDPNSIAFFNRIGIDIVQTYGLTETTGIVSVGKNEGDGASSPIPNIDITLSDAGEVFVRGPMVSDGYFGLDSIDPLVDEFGWLHTRDLGEFDENGRLHILGRIGDTIVTSGGRKVDPLVLENALEKSDHVSRAFLCGNKRPYIVALIQLSDEGNPDELEGLIQKLNGAITTTKTIRDFRVIKQPFSVDRGELTNTGSLRRDAIMRTRAELLETMYVSTSSPRYF